MPYLHLKAKKSNDFALLCFGTATALSEPVLIDFGGLELILKFYFSASHGKVVTLDIIILDVPI